MPAKPSTKKPASSIEAHAQQYSPKAKGKGDMSHAASHPACNLGKHLHPRKAR